MRGHAVLWATLGAVLIAALAIGWAWLRSSHTPSRELDQVVRERRIGPILQTPILPRRMRGEARIDPYVARDLPPLEFAWVDRERGIVRLPIETAMELIAQGALP